MIKVPSCPSAPIHAYPHPIYHCRTKHTVHLGGDDGACEDTAADRDHAGEGALLVDIGALNCRLGRTEPQTNVLVPSPVAGALARSTDLVVQEDVRLQADFC
jgi:hypothetical protein